MVDINANQASHYQNKLQYEIDAWDLHQALENKEDILVIDARSPQAYQHEHIPQAINFPHKTMTQETTAQRLSRNTLYVTYCDGLGCNASTKGALKLAQLGYRVKELIGGIDWWKKEQYPVAVNNSCTAITSDVHCGCG